MKIYLAGYNVDTKILEQLQKEQGKRAGLTPEVLSAAYARISRDSRPINEIRDSARNEVEKSRKSNSTIIFKMGHHSVAEHAVFNLDILGISRLCMEQLQHFRLCSYTEKSQRYIALGKDFVVPKEIKETTLEKDFIGMITKQNEAYAKLLKKLKEHVFKKHFTLAKDPKKHNLLEGWAKEDARYITSLATESQVGQTINARNLELILRRFASHPLDEVQTLGRLLYEKIAEIAPSIVIFHTKNDRDAKTYPQLQKLTSKTLETVKCCSKDGPNEIELVEFTKNGDNAIAAALLHSSSSLTYQQCKFLIENLPREELLNLFKTSWQNMQFYDSMLREFEYANLTFDIVLSAACFGQLKRHRMSTITTQDYDPNLGLTIPESIKEIKMDKYFSEIINETNCLYDKIKKHAPLAASYILTNAHRKRALMRLNLRELYHISRLREDTHAQWDIQNVSRLMSEKANKVMPLACLLIGGKDKYNQIYKNTFGEAPKVVETALPGARKIKT